jgi:hypothetical protein
VRKKPKMLARRESRRLSEIIEAGKHYDRSATEKAKRQTIEAADRLMREMDDLLKRLQRKG